MKQLPNVQQVREFLTQHNLGEIDPELFLKSLKDASSRNNTVPKPKVGDIVLFQANPDDAIAHSNFNEDRIPAIITRKWSDVCVNLKLIPDCGPMQDRTSVVHRSANPTGYNFIFPEESDIPFLEEYNKTANVDFKITDDTKDASSFVKQ